MAVRLDPVAKRWETPRMDMFIPGQTPGEGEQRFNAFFTVRGPAGVAEVPHKDNPLRYINQADLYEMFMVGETLPEKTSPPLEVLRVRWEVYYTRGGGKASFDICRECGNRRCYGRSCIS